MMKQLLKSRFNEIQNLQQCDLLSFMEPLRILKEETKCLKSDLEGFLRDLLAATGRTQYVEKDQFMDELWKYFGRGSSVSGLNNKLFQAIRGESGHYDEVSIQKLNAFIAVYDQYYVLKRGEKEDNRDLYKIMSSLPKRAGENKLQSEYTLAYTKVPNGITEGKIKGMPLVDPAVASRTSSAKVWLKHLWHELDSKFKNISDAFRQFNISKTKLVSFHDFNFILDTLAIRFTKEQTREMFDVMDSDCDGKLSYSDFVNLGESVLTDKDISTISLFYSGANHSTLDPYLQMAKDVEQRKEFDLMEWDDEI